MPLSTIGAKVEIIENRFKFGRTTQLVSLTSLPHPSPSPNIILQCPQIRVNSTGEAHPFNTASINAKWKERGRKDDGSGKAVFFPCQQDTKTPFLYWKGTLWSSLSIVRLRWSCLMDQTWSRKGNLFRIQREPHLMENRKDTFVNLLNSETKLWAQHSLGDRIENIDCVKMSWWII